LRKVIVPFVDRVRQDMQLDDDHPALAVFDHFKGQMTDRVTKELEENNIHSVLIPANCTGYLQPMDISVNKVVKSFLRAEFSEWYSDELSEKFMNGDDDPVDISTARMKCVGGRWFLKLMEHLESNPQITVNGFKHAGIHRALGLLDANDDDIPLTKNHMMKMIHLMKIHVMKALYCACLMCTVTLRAMVNFLELNSQTPKLM